MTEFLRDAPECARLVARGEASAEEITRAALDRVETHDGEIGAFLEVDGRGALEAARAVDAARRAGEPLPALAGVPVAVKDNICVRGFRATCGSRILADYRPPFDATAVERLRAAGAIILGKCNLDEFAMGSSTENSAWQLTRNPWDTTRVPGGSSGGSAAAVAAGMVPLALGSETGGSVRQPAAFCGLLGLKPTYGRVSRWGLVAFSSSMDQIGVLSATSAGGALAARVIAGLDPRDATSAAAEVDPYDEALDALPPGLRIGIPREYRGEGLDPEVERRVEELASRLRGEGMELVEVSLPHTEHAVAAYYLVATAEASSNLARYDGIRYGPRAPDGGGDVIEVVRAARGAGFGPEVKRRIVLGTYALSAGYYEAHYLRGQKVRALLARDFTEAFTRCDALLTPVTPTAAFRLGEKSGDPLSMYLSDIFTCAANLAGVPALAVPAGRTESGLPVGAQFIAPPFGERLLFRLAARVERLLGPPPAPPRFAPPAGGGRGRP